MFYWYNGTRINGGRLVKVSVSVGIFVSVKIQIISTLTTINTHPYTHTNMNSASIIVNSSFELNPNPFIQQTLTVASILLSRRAHTHSHDLVYICIFGISKLTHPQSHHARIKATLSHSVNNINPYIESQRDNRLLRYPDTGWLAAYLHVLSSQYLLDRFF